MNNISEFVAKMQASLERRRRAKTDEERQAAIDEMADLIRGERKPRKSGESVDWKLRQAGQAASPHEE